MSKASNSDIPILTDAAVPLNATVDGVLVIGPVDLTVLFSVATVLVGFKTSVVELYVDARVRAATDKLLALEVITIAETVVDKPMIALVTLAGQFVTAAEHDVIVNVFVV